MTYPPPLTQSLSLPTTSLFLVPALTALLVMQIPTMIMTTVQPAYLQTLIFNSYPGGPTIRLHLVYLRQKVTSWSMAPSLNHTLAVTTPWLDNRYPISFLPRLFQSLYRTACPGNRFSHPTWTQTANHRYQVSVTRCLTSAFQSSFPRDFKTVEHFLIFCLPNSSKRGSITWRLRECPSIRSIIVFHLTMDFTPYTAFHYICNRKMSITSLTMEELSFWTKNKTLNLWCILWEVNQ